MTFDEWWEDFVAEHDEWKYADSAALRRAAFHAGAASRDAEVAELVAALNPFGAIDLVESQLPSEFAMLILRARAAIAKVRKP